MADFDSRLPVRSNGDYDASTNIDPSSSGLVAHDRVATPALTDQNKRITGVSLSTVHALDIALHQSDGSDVSTASPLPVTFSETLGAEIHSYTTSAAVAALASVNHEYTVSGGVTLLLKQVFVSGSGKAKAVLQVETAGGAGTYNTYGVQFNSTADPNMEWNLSVPLVVATGVKVRITITNRDGAGQDLYSTIVGREI